MRAADPREPNVVVDQELPSRRTVLGPSTRQLPLVVPVGALGFGIDYRPVGDIREEELDIIIDLLRVLNGSNRDEPLLVALALHISLLYRVATAERQPGRAMQHPAA